MLFRAGAGEPLVGKNACRFPAGLSVNVFPKIALLALEGVCLIVPVSRDAAVSGHAQRFSGGDHGSGWTSRAEQRRYSVSVSRLRARSAASTACSICGMQAAAAFRSVISSGYLVQIHDRACIAAPPAKVYARQEARENRNGTFSPHRQGRRNWGTSRWSARSSIS